MVGWLAFTLFVFHEVYKADTNHESYVTQMYEPGFYEYEEDGIIKHEYVGEYYHDFGTFWETYGTMEIAFDIWTALLILPSLACLLVGRDYSDGTIRNKLSAGTKRSHILWSNMITVAAVALFMGVISVGIRVFALNNLRVVQIEKYMYIFVLSMIDIVLVYIYVALISVAIVQLMCKRFASIVVLTVIGVVMFFVGAMYAFPMEYSSFRNSYEGGVTDYALQTPFATRAWHFVLSVLSPVGQMSWMAIPCVDGNISYFPEFTIWPYMPYILIVTSIGVSLIAIFVGKVLFDKRDIK